MRKKRLQGGFCFVVSILLLCDAFYQRPLPAQAGLSVKLQLNQVKSLAVANSAAYKKLKVKLELKKASYQSAIKGIQMKKKNLSTIRYSPLLSLKFPDKAMEPEEVEFVFKPMQIQSEIASIQHEMQDTLLAVKEEASNLFTQGYTLQETIKFNEERLTAMQDTLARNEARLLIGEASQSDIDSMKKTAGTLEGKMAADNRKLLALKKKLGKLINLDITTGYEFKNPYQEAVIGREALPELIAYTLQNNHTYYQAKADSKLALLSLDINYGIIKGKYGGKLNQVAGFVNLVKGGGEIDAYALKQAYDKFLVDIDAPWNGSFRIIFIKISKEWLKGAIDGGRFIQDDPYVLYTCILEYQDALKAEENAKETLISQVEDGFENLVTTKNAYMQLKKQAETLSAQAEAALYRNSLGEMPYEELRMLQEEYESTQMDAMEALSLYSQSLFSYDRLTCGAISKYLSAEDLETEASQGGNSYLVIEEYEGISYYIKMILEDYAYEFGIHVPEGFETEVTDYELWCGNYRIVGRTPVDKTIKHIAFSLEDAGKTFVRFYNGERFVDDCEFDPQEYSGPLTVSQKSFQETQDSEQAGTYLLEENEGLGTITMILKPEAEGIAYYTVHNTEGTKMYSEDYIRIDEGFTYLAFALKDLSRLRVHCYDEHKNLVSVLAFDTENAGMLIPSPDD